MLLVLSLAVGACLPALPGAIPTFAAGDEALLARTSGELSSVDGCLVLVGNDGASHAIAWPAPGTSWNSETSTISTIGGNATVGEHISLGGGEMMVTPDNVDGFDWVTAPSEGCLRQEAFWFAWTLLD